MNEFNTLERVMELFKRVNCIGKENCFFYSIRNTQTKPVGGLVGGFVGGMMDGMKAKENNRAWDGYLINQTESGIGLIPLKNTKSIFVVKPENMVVQIGEFIFISNDNISDVKIKRLGLISAVDKTVDIKLKDGADFNLIVRNKEKLISYHEENFLKFVNKYKK